MARAWTKCGSCGDVIWIDNKAKKNAVVKCASPCGKTKLTDNGPEGICYITPTDKDLEKIPK